MRRIISSLCLFAVFACMAVPVSADVSAKSAIVLEATTKKTVYEKDADTRRPMASTTKIMTAVCAIESGDLSREITVTKEAAGVEGSSVYLKVGDKLTLRELVMALMLESANDAATAIAKRYEGKIAYINAMMNMSVDCDCCDVAEDPCMQDIGILASTDPVAIDKACLDLVYASDDPGRDHLLERIESRHGIVTIEAAEKLGIGTTDYKLVEVE